MKRIRNIKTNGDFSNGFTFIELIITMTWFLVIIYLSFSIASSYIKLMKNVDIVGKSLVLTENYLEGYFHKTYAEIDGYNDSLHGDLELIEEIELVDPNNYEIANCEKAFKKIKLSLKSKDKYLLVLYTLKSP